MKIWPALIFLSILYLFSIKAYEPGFFNDDAFFIVGAESLTQGRYAELNHPGEPPLINYLPGYPLLLAPLIAFFSSSLIPLQVLSNLFVLGSVVLLWVLMREEEPLVVLVPTLLMSALNPLTVSLSGTILSDVPYLFFTFLLIFLLKKNWSKKKTETWVYLSLLTGFLFYLRPVGIAFSIALVAALFIEKRHKTAFLCLTVIVLMILPFFIRNMFLRGNLFWYGTEFSDQYVQGPLGIQVFNSWRWHIPYYLHELFNRLFLRLPISWMGFIIGLIFTGVILYGLNLKKKKLKKVGLFIGIYLLVYTLIHLSWHRQSGRYLLPVLPFFYYGIYYGLYQIQKKIKLKKFQLTWGTLALCLFFFMAPLQKITGTFFHPTPFSPPQMTYEWIRHNTDVDDIFVNELDAQLFLLTRRQSYQLPRSIDPNDFSFWLNHLNINYVLLSDTTLQLKTASKKTHHDPLEPNLFRSFLKSSPSFSLVYENSNEKTVIFRNDKMSAQ